MPRLSAVATAVSSVLGTSWLAAPAAAQQEGVIEEVTVTGSRIVRRDFSAASPIMTVDSERLGQSSTVSMETILNQMPQFQPAGTQFGPTGANGASGLAGGGGQASSTATLGIASLNLRGLGPNRTLVLIDGRRPQPGNSQLVVDINTIPTAAIERVETITGGASAVYGPDALAGVVNFVLKDDFEGVDLDFHTSQTFEGDGSENRFSALFGVNSGDGRGNVMVGVEYYDREVVWQSDRDFYREGWFDPQSNAGGFILAPGYSFPATSTNRPTQAAVDAIFPQFAPGTVNISNVAEIYFNPDGSPFVIAQGRGYNGPLNSLEMGGGYGGIRVNRNGNLAQPFVHGMASIPQERRSIFGRATYDMTDNVSAFAQLTYTDNVVTTTGGIPPAITVWQANVPNDGRAIPQALEDLLASRPTPGGDWTLFRGIDYFGEPFTAENNNDVYQAIVGLDGTFPNNDWTWEAYVSTGETNTRNDYRSLPSLQRYQILMNRQNFGQVNDEVFGRLYVLDCPTGFPVFGGGDLDPRCLESLDLAGRASTELTQDIAEFNLQGKAADMPAGELRFAVGAAYRDNTFRFEPLNDDVDITDHPIGIFVSNNTYGEMDVKELYGELLVPATERLSFELGYRYSEFSTAAGDVDTWKALFDYGATDTIRLRGGLQSATRAPNTSELFQGPTLFTVGFGPSDPCSYTTAAPWGNVVGNPDRLQVQQLCIDLIGNPNTPFGGTPGTDAANNFARPGLPFFPLENRIETGNPDLQAEEGETWTFGVVFTSPGNFDGITAAIDLYSIEIEDAISFVDPVFVYAQCFNADGQSNPTYSLDDPGGYCSMIQRQPITGERDQVEAPYVNQGTLKTSGVDLQINWLGDVGPGSMYVNSMLSFLNEYELQDSPTEPFIDYKGTLAQGGQYDYRLNTSVGYIFGGGKANVGVIWSHLPEVDDANTARSPQLTVLGVDAYDRFNLFASYQFTDRISMRGGIDNLFDEEPPIVGSDPNNATAPNRNAFQTNTQFYDILGRSGYLALNVAF